MDWLCPQTLTYLRLGRGGYELDSNISPLYGDSIIANTDNILFGLDNITWHGDIIAGRGQLVGLGAISRDCCCAAVAQGGFQHNNQALGHSNSLNIGHFENRK